jgi:hypothetical protein
VLFSSPSFSRIFFLFSFVSFSQCVLFPCSFLKN